MFKQILLLIIIVTVVVSCRKIKHETVQHTNAQKLIVKSDNLTPGVNVTEFTLISNTSKPDKSIGLGVIEEFKKLSAAMLTRDSVSLSDLLSARFVYHAPGRFYQRPEFIKFHISSPDTIMNVDYSNVTMQYFDSLALVTSIKKVTYKGYVTDSVYIMNDRFDEFSNSAVYIKETGNWKLLSLFEIITGSTHPTSVLKNPVKPDTSFIGPVIPTGIY